MGDSVPNKFTVLETERFRLRKIEPKDIDVLFGYWSDAAVTEYLPHTFNSIQQVEEMVEMLNGLVEKGEGTRWAIVSKSNDEVVAPVATTMSEASTDGQKSGMNWGQTTGVRMLYRRL